MPTERRLGEIDFWKFAASVFIVLFHTRTFYEPDLFPSGFSMAVEFFFVVTGFFFAASVYRDERPFSGKTIGKETVQFIFRKLNGFLYTFLICFALSAAACVFQNGARTYMNAEALMNGLFEVTLLSNVTGTPCSIIPADWYLSAMMLSLFLLYPFFRRSKDLFSAYAAPLLAVSLLGYLLAVYGVIGNEAAGSFPPKNVVRAVCAICFGVTAYRAAALLGRRRLSAAGKALCTAGAALFALLTFASLFFINGKTQPLVVVFSAAFVALAASGQSAAAKLFPAALCRRLGEFSLSLYLSHTAVRSFLLGLMLRRPELKPYFTNGDRQWLGVLIFLALSAVLAAAVTLLAKALRGAVGKRKA